MGEASGQRVEVCGSGSGNEKEESGNEDDGETVFEPERESGSYGCLEMMTAHGRKSDFVSQDWMRVRGSVDGMAVTDADDDPRRRENELIDLGTKKVTHTTATGRSTASAGPTAVLRSSTTVVVEPSSPSPTSPPSPAATATAASTTSTIVSGVVRPCPPISLFKGFNIAFLGHPHLLFFLLNETARNASRRVLRVQ